MASVTAATAPIVPQYDVFRALLLLKTLRLSLVDALDYHVNLSSQVACAALNGLDKLIWPNTQAVDFDYNNA
jgi:hypothetical protein